ncbi:unnamed protein product [Closterium sp. NIES-65]|nr:unnamed protein product [Closterium sp. NIES-65]
MANPSVLTFDTEGRAVDFEVWVDDLQLFLQCDKADDLSLFDLTSSASPAPPATADSTVRSQWATRDAAARLAVRVFPLPPSCHLLLLLLLPTSLVSTGSALRLPLAGDAAPARARGARELEGLAGAVEVVVEAVEGVGVVVGVVAEVAAAVAAVEAEEAAVVAEGAEAAEVAEEAEVVEAAEAATAAASVELVATLRRGVGPVVVRASSSSAVVRPCPLSSVVSGTLRVSAVGVQVPALTSSVPATALVSSAGARTPPSAALAA